MKNTCHICLEEKEYDEENLLKICCNAFICNPCWSSILENENINQCPICSFNIFNEIVDENIIEAGGNNISCKDTIRKILIIIKWFLIGYLLNIFVLLIYHLDIREVYNTMCNLHMIVYFWPINTFLGYLIVIMYEYYSNRNCHNWYN